MAHGYYDYGVSREVKTVHASPDMAEQAVRRGAVSSVDRRGNVIAYDDFEPATLKWVTAVTPPGRIDKSNDYARSGDYSLKFVTRPVEDDSVHAYTRFAYPVASRFGLEIWFQGWQLAGALWFDMDVYTFTDTHRAMIRYDFTTFALEYSDAAGAWQPIDTYPFRVAPYAFYPIKIVYDANTRDYVRVLFHDREYDLTGIPTRLVGAGSSPYVEAHIYAYTFADEAFEAYVDDLIFTQNEP